MRFPLYLSTWAPLTGGPIKGATPSCQATPPPILRTYRQPWQLQIWNTKKIFYSKPRSKMASTLFFYSNLLPQRRFTHSRWGGGAGAMHNWSTDHPDFPLSLLRFCQVYMLSLLLLLRLFTYCFFFSLFFLGFLFFFCFLVDKFFACACGYGHEYNDWCMTFVSIFCSCCHIF